MRSIPDRDIGSLDFRSDQYRQRHLRGQLVHRLLNIDRTVEDRRLQLSDQVKAAIESALYLQTVVQAELHLDLLHFEESRGIVMHVEAFRPACVDECIHRME